MPDGPDNPIAQTNEMLTYAQQQWAHWQERALVAEQLVQDLKHSQAVDKITIQDLEKRVDGLKAISACQTESG